MTSVMRSRVVPSGAGAKIVMHDSDGLIVNVFVSSAGVPESEGVLVPAVRDGVVPEQLIERYISAALRRVLVEQMEDGRYFASIPILRGVWAEGETPDEALNEAGDVAREWIVMKIEDQDRDLPVLGTLDLNWL